MRRILQRFRPRFYHQHHDDFNFDKLYARFDNQIAKYPQTVALEDMMTRLLTNDQAEFLSKVPRGLVTVTEMVEKYDGVKSEEEVKETLEDLFKLGMLFENHDNFFHFPEMIVGWYEYVWMKDRSGELPVDELVQCTLDYTREWKKANVNTSPIYPNQLRTLIREEAIPHHEVVDYESAKKIIENAVVIGVGDCCCQRIRTSLMDPEDAKKYNEKYPIRRCLGFDSENETFVSCLERHDMGEIITEEEALEILEFSHSKGLVQNVDNQKNPLYLCNCERETCGALEPYRFMHLDLVSGEYNYMKGEKPTLLMGPLTPSRFITSNIDPEKCIGCRTCEKMCPCFCFSCSEDGVVELDNYLCIGCGVCATFCSVDAIEMEERPTGGDDYISARFVPDSMLRRKIDSVVELGKVHALLFNDDEKMIHRLLSPIFRVFENSGIGQKIFNKESFREKLVEKTKKKAQDLKEK